MKRSLYSVISLMLMVSIGLSGCITSPDAETANGGSDGGDNTGGTSVSEMFDFMGKLMIEDLMN